MKKAANPRQGHSLFGYERHTNYQLINQDIQSALF